MPFPPLSHSFTISLYFLTFFFFFKFINHKAIDYKIISSPFTSYLLFCSAKKVLYPSAPFAFITLFSRNGPSRVTIAHNQPPPPPPPPPFFPSLFCSLWIYIHMSTSKRTTFFLVSINNNLRRMTFFTMTWYMLIKLFFVLHTNACKTLFLLAIPWASPGSFKFTMSW